MRRRWSQRAAIAWACALVAACSPSYDPCFEPPSVVDTVRLLAVRADPPEALVDLDSGVVPAVTVRALVAGAGDPEATLQLVARLCAPTADLRCPDGSASQEGAISEPGAQEGSLVLQVDPGLIASARAADPLRGFGGTRVQLELEARVTTDLGPRSASATKTLLFSDAATTPAPNQPIEVGEVDATVDGVLNASAMSGGLVEMLVGEGYGLRPRLLPLADGGSPLEVYETTDLGGQQVTLREQVSYDFFAQPDVLFGDLPIDDGTPVGVYIAGASLADEPQPGVSEPPDGLVRATPMLMSQSRVWVVARDSRGAVAWTWFDARIFDARVCDGPNGEICPAGKSCCADPFIGCR